MSFGDETQDIVTRTGRQVRLRLHRKEDSQDVRDLFMYCMGKGPGAPREAAFADQLRQPHSLAAYSIFTVGLALSIRPSLPQTISSALLKVYRLFPSSVRTLITKSDIPRLLGYLRPERIFTSRLLKQRKWPMILTALTAGSFVAYMALVNNVFIGYCKQMLKEDLKDIADYYQNPEALKKGGNFWVIEDVDKGTIVGSVGLDAHGPSLELRRMCVHPSYRRLGFGNILINAILAHVVKHNAKCSPELRAADIVVGTSSYQLGALKMYQNRGWVLENTFRPEWFLRRFIVYIMRRKMDPDAGHS